MEFAKKYFRVAANSILESVIALSIIAICLFVSILVYQRVFDPKTGPQLYRAKNHLNSLYYQMQMGEDSLNTDRLLINRTWINSDIQQVDIEYKDSSGVVLHQNFYIPIE
jgi:hypothetical protein